MNKSVHTNEPIHVACEICLTEVPRTDAQYEEAGDYVMYFCGLECYKIWREQDDEKR